ncbi:hypothetical protein [Virgibacillus senegalensis]|uniref:hypothetical protein n=1 Tax=Virgibacillus senegalensis TaxID=1499679 RepID=UPI000A99C752|nr:hypothetical protein [Virgibacillus senegalensis]
MLNKFSEEDFLVFRNPLVSGRHSPAGIGGLLLAGVAFQAFFLRLEYFVKDFSSYPYKENIFIIHFCLSCIIVTLSVLFAVSPVYMRAQRLQYFISILSIQNIGGVSIYILALLALGADVTSASALLLKFTSITLAGGILVFLLTCIRLYFLIQNGKFRKGSSKNKQRTRLEKQTRLYLPIVVIGSTGLVFIMEYIMRNFNVAGIDTIIMVTLMIAIFYTMLFVLPEQLVILYCKYRFDSFNYEQNGQLKPIRDQAGNIVDENVEEDISYKELYEEMEDWEKN